jgi:trans-aconitate methyltransferase
LSTQSDGAAAAPARRHWDDAHRLRPPTQCSWYTVRPAISLELFDELGVGIGEAILDVGGGASTLADALLARGHTDLTVLDVSPVALAIARDRLGADSRIRWIESDLLDWTPPRRYAIWHDRALFHFLTELGDRARYRDTLRQALAPGGGVVIGAFAADGPTSCSGLPVVRYTADALAAELGDNLRVVATRREEHTTPAGVIQPFTWVAARRTAAAD